MEVEDTAQTLESLPDAVLVCDADGRVAQANPAVKRLLLWSPAALVGQPFARLVPERVREVQGLRLERYLLRRAAERGGTEVRVPLKRADGLERLVTCTASAAPHDGVVLVARPLAAALELEGEPLERQAGAPPLPSGEALFQLIVQHAPLGIFHFDQQPVVTAANAQVAHILGVPRDAVLGLNLLSLRDEALMACVQRVLRGDQCRYEGTYRVVTSGREVPMRVHFAPCHAPGTGEVTGGVAIVEDVSARRSVERERNESLALLDTFFRTAPIGLAFVDPALHYQRVNEELAAFDVLPPEEHVGRPLSEVPGPASELLGPLVRRVLDSGRALERQAMSTRELGAEPGQERHYEGSLYPVRTRGGRLTGVGVVMQDVTARKGAEAERARLLREAREAVRVRDDFLTVASHELKTPLTPLALRLASLERQLARGEPLQPEQLARARAHLTRLTALINDLLDASRVEAGKLSLHREPIRLAALVDRVIAQVTPPSDRHRLVFERSEAELRVMGDPYRLEQVLLNLVDNALKYSPDGGTIRVRLGTRGSVALLSVQDPGIGVPREQQPHLFERHFRGRNVSTRSYGGLGLGLYICRDIVERHGGRIWVESEPGQGSTFHVALPLLEPAALGAPAPLAEPRPH